MEEIKTITIDFSESTYNILEQAIWDIIEDYREKSPDYDREVEVLNQFRDQLKEVGYVFSGRLRGRGYRPE